MSESGGATSDGATGNGAAGASTNGAARVQVKPGRHREATLYHALHGAGAGDGRTLAQLREAALRAYERLRAAGVAALGLLDARACRASSCDALQTSVTEAGRAGRPDVTRTLPDRPRAGRIVQSAGAVVQRGARRGAG